MARNPAQGSKIQIYHSTAPTCFWSWGYEALFNRLKLVYGNQIDMRIQISCVYEDFDEYLKHYELTFDGLREWTEEAIGIMGIPLNTRIARTQFPPSVLPASMAAMAAMRQGTTKGTRFFRALLRRSSVEGQDVAREAVLFDAASEAKLNLTRFKRDLADRDRLLADYQNQGDDFYHMPLGFYNVILTDGKNRTVILDHAFDPKTVDDALDYLSVGSLKRRKPTDIAGYLRDHGPAPVREIERVFSLSRNEADTKLHALKTAGKATSTRLAGAPHWSST